MSGYVAILFGRNRASEDVDIIIEKPDYDNFKKLWDEINKKYECINAFSSEEAYNEYLSNNTPIRFEITASYHFFQYCLAVCLVQLNH